MVCERWKTQLDIYIDGELPSEQMHDFDAHVRNCASCAADALVRVQLKRYVQTVGKRFAPRAEFRQDVYRKIAGEPTRRVLSWNWVLAAALALIFATGLAVTYRGALSFRPGPHRLWRADGPARCNLGEFIAC